MISNVLWAIIVHLVHLLQLLVPPVSTRMSLVRAYVRPVHLVTIAMVALSLLRTSLALLGTIVPMLLSLLLSILVLLELSVTTRHWSMSANAQTVLQVTIVRVLI